MCWSSKTLEKQIATEDIKVFKVGYNKVSKLVSYYKCFVYDFNKLYETVIERYFVGEFYEINQGFHSYNSNICIYEEHYDKVAGRYSVVRSKITKGLIDKMYGFTSLVECIIPKGAEYYENEDGEIVSNQIIIIK